MVALQDKRLSRPMCTSHLLCFDCSARNHSYAMVESNLMDTVGLETIAQIRHLKLKISFWLWSSSIAKLPGC